jgi:hypothetical protein
MLWIAAANDADNAVPLDHFAMLANRFYTATNFHAPAPILGQPLKLLGLQVRRNWEVP